MREYKNTERAERSHPSGGLINLVSNGVGPSESRRELLAAWEDRSRAVGADPSACSGPDAIFLVSALGAALKRGSQTPELGRAARSWGARFSAPVEALAALSALRETVVDATRAPLGDGTVVSGLPAASDNVNRVLDQVMLEAVDAASANLRAQARTDPLTGCANRLAFHEDLGHAANSAYRSGLDLALAEVDLDGLKRINDTKGHAAGDDALLGLVSRLREELRDADTLYRTGGDEFVVIAPFTDAAGAAAMLDRASEGEGPRFSWGVASMRSLGPEAAENPELLMAAADNDLYARRRYSRAKADAATTRRTRPVVVLAGAGLASVVRRQRLALASAGTSVADAARREGRALVSAAGSARSSVSAHRRLAASVAASLLLAAAGLGGLTAALESGSPSSPGFSTASPPLHHPSGTGSQSQQGNGNGSSGTAGTSAGSVPPTTAPPSAVPASGDTGTAPGATGSTSPITTTGSTPSGLRGSSTTGALATGSPGSPSGTGTTEAGAQTGATTPLVGSPGPASSGGVHALIATPGASSAAPASSSTHVSSPPATETAVTETTPSQTALANLTAVLGQLASGSSLSQGLRSSRSLSSASVSEGPVLPTVSAPVVAGNLTAAPTQLSTVAGSAPGEVTPRSSQFLPVGPFREQGSSGAAPAATPSIPAPPPPSPRLDIARGAAASRGAVGSGSFGGAFHR